ncbi:MAG: hypothetical protein NTZ44_02425 [Candidatus Nomurabacteria bacterium]|nr:hypothetical protein [Candidatus Nomurabacteria bacterium]
MTWALKRQIIYFLIFICIIGIFGFWILYPHFTQAPTCKDNKQNGTETGVDCGGSCILACPFQVDNVAVLWARSFRVVPGKYNAVAYLENKNKNNAVYKLHYKFRFADKDNIFIGNREGDTYIPTQGKFAILEPAIDVGNSIPVFTSFEFTEKPIWIQIPEEKVKELQILIGDISLSGEDTNPSMSTTLKNNSLFKIPSVKAVAILYDSSGNAVNASSTFIDSISGGVTVPITFTWPEAFSQKIVAKEILPIFNIFSVKFN